jgi:hypothetical protein
MTFRLPVVPFFQKRFSESFIVGAALRVESICKGLQPVERRLWLSEN